MGYHNFASDGYTALNPFQPGEYFDLGGVVRLVFSVGDEAANRATMVLVRPATSLDLASRLAGLTGPSGLSGPMDPTLPNTLTREGAIVTAIVNFFEAFNALSNATAQTEVSRALEVVGLGLDDGHRGSRERHIETFEDAVRERGVAWAAPYKNQLNWGGFFVESSDVWYSRGALASQHGVLIFRLDSTHTNLEVGGFRIDRGSNLCRLENGIAVRTSPTFEAL